MPIASDDPVLRRISEWAKRRDDVRVVLLTSSRARADARIDRFSDYDIMLFLSGPSALATDAGWLNELGRVLVTFDDIVDSYSMRLVLFEDGTKIDFALGSLGVLERIVSERQLPAILDVGFRVVLDKDGLAARLPSPTCTAHVPRPPTAREFADLVREFWWETTYVAKQLWRDELLPAKHSLDTVIALGLLRRLLEWHIETGRDWRVRPGDLGRGLAKQLDPATWSELASVFAGSRLEDNWDALFRAMQLFRRIARDVADRLALEYPMDLDARVTAYVESVRATARV
ncbi:MAG TPA: aminoglycoside 6-adenylyltransferase [Vicinamibacterales bacterium]